MHLATVHAPGDNNPAASGGGGHLSSTMLVAWRGAARYVPGVPIPFYGASHPDLFAIERGAMDRSGAVVAALDERLPERGIVVDVGAGDGFTAARLATDRRRIVPVEPAEGMRRQAASGLPFVGGVAETLPFRSGACDAAFATWSYFFTGEGWDPAPGIAELHRVVRPGGPLLVVDNLGGDEFTAMAPHDIAADREHWRRLGFGCDEITTDFTFTHADDARALLDLYFGPAPRADPELSYTYRVGLFHATSTGPPSHGWRGAG